MHATLITTNISQHCPDGCHNHTRALEGDMEDNMPHTFFHAADEFGRLAVAVTPHVFTKWSSF